MPVTIKDIARTAGVSTSTAARILGDYGYASADAKARVMKASKDLNYHPNIIAKSIVKKKTNSFGLIITDIDNPFFITLIKEVESYAKSYGYSIIFSNSDENFSKEQDAIDTMVGRQVDGLIIVPVGETGLNRKKKGFKGLEYLISQQKPFVLIDRVIQDVQADSIVVDNYQPAIAETKKLLTDGYRNIVIVRPDQRINTIMERYEGFLQAFKDEKIPFDIENDLVCDFQAHSAYKIVQEYLKRNEPEAFLTLDYQMSLGTIKAIQKHYQGNTKDLQIVGFDELGYFEDIIPFKIKTIKQPIKNMVRLAIDRLIYRIEHSNDSVELVSLKIGM